MYSSCGAHTRRDRRDKQKQTCKEKHASAELETPFYVCRDSVDTTCLCHERVCRCHAKVRTRSRGEQNTLSNTKKTCINVGSTTNGVWGVGGRVYCVPCATLGFVWRLLVPLPTTLYWPIRVSSLLGATELESI